MFDGRLGSRVSRLESNLSELSRDVSEVRDAVGGFSSKIDRLVDGLSSTGERANQRAQAVKDELREETDRKSKERSSLVASCVGVLGAIGLIVTALTGPWKEKLETTATGQTADTVAIGGVREVLAQQGAAIGRNGDSIDLAREKNRMQDAELREHDRDLAELHGYLAAKIGAPAR